MWSLPRLHIGTLLYLVFINALHYVNKYYKVQFIISVKAVNNEHIKIKKKGNYSGSRNAKNFFCVISIKEIF